MPNRRISRRWLLALASALLAGCLSPTMPMPPPSRPVVEGPDERGVVVLSGKVPPGSTVYADNLSTRYSYGRGADVDTGAYRLPILASVGDNISLFYRLETEDSMATTFRIPKPTASANGVGGAAGAAGVGGAAGAAGVGGATAGAGGG